MTAALNILEALMLLGGDAPSFIVWDRAGYHQTILSGMKYDPIKMGWIDRPHRGRMVVTERGRLVHALSKWRRK